MIGIDIGATYTKLAWVDMTTGKILRKERFGTQEFTQSEDFLDALTDRILALAQTDRLTGVGIGAPNANFKTGCIAAAANLPWKGTFALRQGLQNRLKVPVFLDNDANVAALGEGLFGAARGMQNFIVITLGTGLGSGIVAEGRLIRGHSGLAGELGHLTWGSEGRLSGYGRPDAAETYLSATGLQQTYLREWGRPSRLTAREIAQLAEQGDDTAQKAFAKTGNRLGKFLAEIALFSSPEAIFLAGGLVEAGHWLLDATRAAFVAHLLPPLAGQVRVEVSALPSGAAALLGAAALAAGFL